jgi:hypothetical protein
MSPDSSDSIEMGNKLDGHGSISHRGKSFLSTPQCPVRLWDPPNLLLNGHPGLKGSGR